MWKSSTIIGGGGLNELSLMKRIPFSTGATHYFNDLITTFIARSLIAVDLFPSMLPT